MVAGWAERVSVPPRNHIGYHARHARKLLHYVCRMRGVRGGNYQYL